MNFFKTTTKSKASKITIAVLVVILFACAIGGGAYGIYRAFFTPYVEPNFPDPVIGIDASAAAYKAAATSGKTRAVCVQGRRGGILDDKTYWSGFLVSSDGYIVTSYLAASGGIDTPSQWYTDYVIKVLDKDGVEQTYFAEPTLIFNKATGMMMLKLKDIPSGVTFDYFKVAASSSVTFGTEALIMGNAVGEGLMAHSASVGNPSTTLDDSSNLNDYLTAEIMFVNGAVNNGSKGSPLINKDGKVIGMILSRHLLPPNKHPNDTIMTMGYAAKADDIVSLLARI